MRGTLNQSRRTRGGMWANQSATDRESEIAEKPAISRTEDPRFWTLNNPRYRGYISCRVAPGDDDALPVLPGVLEVIHCPPHRGRADGKGRWWARGGRGEWARAASRERRLAGGQRLGEKQKRGGVQIGWGSLWQESSRHLGTCGAPP